MEPSDVSFIYVCLLCNSVIAFSIGMNVQSYMYGNQLSLFIAIGEGMVFLWFVIDQMRLFIQMQQEYEQRNDNEESKK